LFIDDIVIFSDIAKEYKRYLEAIFSLFKSKNIALAPTKLFISYPSIELLRFYIDLFGLITTAKRIAIFKNLAFPSILKALE
jgi:predicted HAD superfamily hydrolase